MSGVNNPAVLTAASLTAGLNLILTTRGDMLRRGATDAERLALGANTQVVTSDGTDAAWAAAGGGGGALTREGGQSTEATTTSTTAVDLLTASSLTIAALEPLLAFVDLGKSTGAAAEARVGIKLNTAIMIEAGSATNWSGADDSDREGYAIIQCGARASTYTRPGVMLFGSGDADRSFDQAFDATGTPTVEITDVIIRGEVASGSITMRANNLQVYSLASS